MDAKATGALIAERRRALGLSQAALAERLHVTDKAVSRWETGRGMPALDSLEPLAEALGLSVSELLSGRELTAEELPGEAGSQIVGTMRKSAGMVRRGALTALLVPVLAALFLLGHYVTSVSETDRTALARQAEKYLGSEGTRLVETERKGAYLAALCTDDNGSWCMCVFDRDKVFKDRWVAGGGTPNLRAGELGSWNFGDPREAVIILCGGDLPEEAACYTFQNGGVTYICPVQDRQVLDVFLLPENGDTVSHQLKLLDMEGQLLDGHIAGAAAWVP